MRRIRLRLGKYPSKNRKAALRKKFRFTVKVVFYDRLGRVFTTTSGLERGGSLKPNFPGGAPEKGERTWKALKREVGEETNVSLPDRVWRQAPIIWQGAIDTTRSGFEGKYLVLCAVEVTDIYSIATINGELANPRTHDSAAAALAWLELEATEGTAGARRAYREALLRLGELLPVQ